MNALENRIPPPLVALIVGACMWAIARSTPPVLLPNLWRAVALAIVAIVCLAFGGSAFRAFASAKTTINPVDIRAASALVTTGPFRVSRNPMYVALTSLLVCWAIYLSAPWALTGVVLFVAFITRFQIVPEERVMHEKFGRQYEAYQTRVRRWL